MCALSRLSNLSYLDVSYCNYIGAPALEAIGKHCKYLTRFERAIDPGNLYKSSLDVEASDIAATMPKVKHLVIGFLNISNEGLLKVLSSYPELEILDNPGCWRVNLDNKFVKEFSNMKVLQVIHGLLRRRYF